MRPFFLKVSVVLEIARLTNRLLAILTSSAEGTMRELTTRSDVDCEVRCESRANYTVQRQQRLCAP